MSNIFYTLIIFPIEQIIELCYSFAFRLTKSSGLSIIGLSAAISTIILPIYLMAENKQKAERDKQKQMKGKIDKIKAVFKGDERYMLLSTFYRQNNYHPIYALRNSIDLFIQIPFFIAAYHFLHNLEALNGQSFIFFKDLGAPDRLLGNINLLPILMTVVNCVSGMIYSRGLLVKEKIQLYGTALVFLVLLYNSPSALVLYWTCNNIYNLVKNIILKNDKLKKLIYPAVILLICCLIAYILLFPRSIGILRRIAAVFLAGLLIFLLFKNKIMEFCGKKIKLKSISVEHTGKIFALSVTGLFLLIGLVIPSSLIASSVEEFAFRKPFSSPLPFVGITFLQSAGILFWLVCIYAIFTKQVRLAMTFLLTIVLGIFMVNVFCFRPDYGFMTPDLKFSNFHSVSSMYKLINIIILLTGAVVITLLFMVKKEKLLLALQSIIILSLIGYGTMNIFRINNNFTMLNTGEGRTPTSDNFNGFNKSYTFSKTGKNVLLIMLDRAISGYVPYIFEEKPELLDSFKGFIYYPNTISYGGHTIYGIPGIFGGYYYTPLEIQKRKNELWIKKYHESMQVLPRIMAGSGFMVTVHNQPWMDNSLYDNINNITVDRNYDYLTNIYLQNNNDIEFFDYYKLYYYSLIRFSFLKTSPLFLQNFLYDNGGYLIMSTKYRLNTVYYYPTSVINEYAYLYFLSNITDVLEDDNNYFSIIVNDLAHSPSFFEVPEYKPSRIITNIGNGLFASEDNYHVNMASFLLLAKWFDFLKENNVYNNTRIIIVSDHGSDNNSPFPNNIILPNGIELESYAALLMVKDFESEFTLRTDNSFMTNADVPHLATEEIIKTVTNPFTYNELLADKNNGVTITSSTIWEPEKMLKYEYKIKHNEWLHVKDNIFDSANWSKVTINK